MTMNHGYISYFKKPNMILYNNVNQIFPWGDAILSLLYKVLTAIYVEYCSDTLPSSSCVHPRKTASYWNRKGFWVYRKTKRSSFVLFREHNYCSCE